jgi:HK97 family phage portal protein
MFLSLLKASSDDRSPWSDFWFKEIGLKLPGTARVTADSAMRLSAVYGCVRVLAETMACLPFTLYKKREDGGKDIVTDHWLYRLIARRPNNWQTPFEWMEMLEAHLALRGNAYNYIDADSRGEIRQLIPLHPDRVTLELLTNGSFRYKYVDRNGNTVYYSRHELWHLRGMSSDGYSGISVLGAASQTIATGLSAQSYGNKFFANDARPSGGWIEFAGNFRDKPARQKFRDDWQENQGAENRGKVAVLENGMKYHEVGLTNKDSQFIEVTNANVPAVCRYFRMPPHMIQDLTRSTNNNIEWQSLEFVKFTMTPWAERWESSIEYSLLPDDTDLECEFDFDNLERGDTAARSEYYTAGINAGWLVRNEARKKENMNPLPGLDEPLEPMNMGGSPADTKKKPGRQQQPAQQEDPKQEDDASARLRLIAMAAAERVARKEREHIARALKAGTAEVAAAYDKHAHFVAACLMVSLERAQAYCAEQFASLDQHELVEDFELRARCKLERLALMDADVCTQTKGKP